MDLLLTETQARLCTEARAVAEELLAPGAVARDRAASFPAAEIHAIAARGYLGMTVANDFGGAGWDAVTATLILSEISQACASTGLVAGLHALAVCEMLERRGSSAAREEFLPRLARGELLGALALTDPAPSDVASPPALVLRQEEELILRGCKIFVPGAVAADLFLVYARAGDESGGGRRRVLVLVPRWTKGLEIGPADPIFGVRAAGVAGLRFQECRVPAAYQVGPIEEARSLATDLLACADLAVASQAVGIATAAFAKAAARAKEREPSGLPLGSRQVIQWKLADMQVLLDASRLFVLRAASARDRGEAYGYEAAQAKTFAGRAAARIADEAVQVFGGSGAITDGGVERHWRDAKTTELNPTPREAAQLAIARRLLEEVR